MPRVPVLHLWDLDRDEASKLQLALAPLVDSTRPLACEGRTIGSINSARPAGV